MTTWLVLSWDKKDGVCVCVWNDAGKKRGPIGEDKTLQMNFCECSLVWHHVACHVGARSSCGMFGTWMNLYTAQGPKYAF